MFTQDTATRIFAAAFSFAVTVGVVASAYAVIPTGTPIA